MKTHPSIVHNNYLQSICRPLQTLKITYFAQARIDKEKRVSTLSTSSGFLQYYLDRQYYDADIHLIGNKLGQYIIWDNIERRGRSLAMHTEAAQFGVKHTFTIVKHYEQYSDYFHFASDLCDRTINQIYLSNIDVLELFIANFLERVKLNKELSKAYQLKYCINSTNAGYAIHNEKLFEKINLLKFKNKLLNAYDKSIYANKDLPRKKGLSPREIECLYWAANGKSTHEIAIILNLSQLTIDSYFKTAILKLGAQNRTHAVIKAFLRPADLHHNVEK